MKAGITNRIKRLETLKAPGPPLEAMLIHRRPGEPRGEAEARYFAANPERRGDTRTPRIYLILTYQEVNPCEAN
jgi:hypothetical protein